MRDAKRHQKSLGSEWEYDANTNRPRLGGFARAQPRGRKSKPVQWLERILARSLGSEGLCEV